MLWFGIAPIITIGQTLLLLLIGCVNAQLNVWLNISSDYEQNEPLWWLIISCRLMSFWGTPKSICMSNKVQNLYGCQNYIVMWVDALEQRKYIKVVGLRAAPSSHWLPWDSEWPGTKHTVDNGLQREQTWYTWSTLGRHTEKGYTGQSIDTMNRANASRV